MLPTFARSALAAFALAASAHAGNVQVNFSGGSGAPLTITLPQAVSFTVTNDTPGAVVDFVFQGVGNFIGGSALVSGSLSYTTNGGSPLAINIAGTFPLGVVTTNDLSLFRNSSPGVGQGDVLLLSSGSVTTNANITAAAPPSGLYSAIFVDVNGVQLGVGVGAAVGRAGDFDLDQDVDGADFLKWQRGESPTPLSSGDLTDWRTNFGATSLGAASHAVPEPSTATLIIIMAVASRCRRSTSSRTA
jgi:hypothetical protein